MTTVKQLREYLATLPDEQYVKVLRECSGSLGTYTKWVDLKLPTKEDGYTENCYPLSTALELGES